MIDYTLTSPNTAPKGALEVGLHAREHGKEMALLAGEYRKAIKRASQASPLKALFGSLLSFL